VFVAHELHSFGLRGFARPVCGNNLLHLYRIQGG